MTADRFARLILGAGMLAGTLVLVYVVLGRERFLATGSDTAFFLGLPGIVVLGCLYVWRRTSETRILAAILMASVALAFYGFETYLAVRGPLAPPAGVDSRTKYQMSMDLRKQGRDAWPAAFPEYLLQTRLDSSLGSPIRVGDREVLPLGGIARATTVLCNEDGPYEVYESDELGFHNPPGLWADGRDGLRVAAVGDSFTQGYCVSSDANFVARIRQRLPRTANLGTSGAGPLIELAALREFLPPFKPSWVVWFFYEGNDLQGNLPLERRSPLLMRYLEEDGFRQDLAGQATAVDAAYRAYLEGLFRGRPERRETDAGPLQRAVSFVGLAGLRAAVRRGDSSPPIDTILFARILERAKRTTESWGGRLLFVYLPTSVRYMGPGPARDKMIAQNRQVLAVAAGAEIPVVDLADVFARQADPLALYIGRGTGHFNAAGHAAVAQAVLAVIAPE